MTATSSNPARECQPGIASLWQPIDSAPKDGTRVLLFRHTSDGTVVGFYKPDWKGWHTSPGHYSCVPTYWQPLPPPPEAI